MKFSENHSFRPEIQGIRLIGALLVASFHIWGNSVSGGVDVFFVISGYFLGFSQINRERLENQFNVHNHISKFINRTVPEVLLVLIFCLISTLLIISPASWKDNFTHIIFSALYIENFWLIIKSTDYLARNENLSIVQHFWAISIIAQVYMSWIFIYLIAKILNNFKNKTITFYISLLLSISIILSFFWGVWFTAHNPEAAYFDFFSRYWQFCIGALAAILASNINKRSTILTEIGVLLILSCGFVVGSKFNFPGVVALWPVIGVILILIYAKNSESIFKKILSHPKVVQAGNLGFGVYLWHWPIYVSYLKLTDNKPGIFSGFIIIILSFILSSFSSKISKRLKEKRDKYLFLKLIGFLFLIVILCFSIRKTITDFPRIADQIVAKYYRSSIYPGPFSNNLSLPDSYAEGCHISIYEKVPKTCIFNQNGKDGKVYLVGGSHAAHWLPALQEIMIQKDFKLYTSTKSSCTFADTNDDFLSERDFNQSCIEWNKSILNEILEVSPDIVVVIGTRTRQLDNAVEEIIPQAYQNNFKILMNHNIKVLAIRDTPNMGDNIPACVHKRNYNEAKCQRLRTDRINDAEFEKYKKSVSNWLYISDPMKYFCSDKICNAVHNNVMIYRDAHHLTIEYSKELAPWLRGELEKLNNKNWK